MQVGPRRPRLLGAALLAAAAVAVAGCGGAAESPTAPTVRAGADLRAGGFAPARPVAAGRPCGWRSGSASPTARDHHFARGNGPTPAALIIVRDDLA